MATYDIDPHSENESGSIIWVSLLFLGIGYLFGGGIEGDRKEQAALNWAVHTTKNCEISYKADGYARVTDCLKEAIAKAEEEECEEARAEGYDPRR